MVFGMSRYTRRLTGSCFCRFQIKCKCSHVFSEQCVVSELHQCIHLTLYMPVTVLENTVFDYILHIFSFFPLVLSSFRCLGGGSVRCMLCHAYLEMYLPIYPPQLCTCMQACPRIIYSFAHNVCVQCLCMFKAHNVV